MKSFEKKLRFLFDYQRFENNDKLGFFLNTNDDEVTVLADDQLFAVAGGQNESDKQKTDDNKWWYHIDMLEKEMSLREMIDFKPSDIQMASLPLDIVVYIKVSIVSLYKEDNYDFIRYLFENEEIKEYIKDTSEIELYDFDGTGTKQERFVTIFEMNSLYNYENVSSYLKEVLEGYNHVADVIIDFYTHDNKKYRLSNLDGIVVVEPIK